ncbi:hypothetical protein DVV91_09940 [Clostridium botulinum]|uniref:DUF6501 family protein n=1 Tax=Clostridium botulinum TaxID=1491 RepID=UPI0019682BF8|nr:DUF6501 family protein [Clostridium botulinum]MBN1074661.1 hypothetical protein [Clostridium botulinum]
MKVKCKNNDDFIQLTIGKEYEVKDESRSYYLIFDDTGNSHGFNKELFEVVEEESLKFEDIIYSPIKGIMLNCLDENYFINGYIRKDIDDSLFIENGDKLMSKVKPSEIPQLIEWLQKVNTYIGQVKNKTKEMTIEEIEKELGHRIKIVGDEK